MLMQCGGRYADVRFPPCLLGFSPTRGAFSRLFLLLIAPGPTTDFWEWAPPKDAGGAQVRPLACALPRVLPVCPRMLPAGGLLRVRGHA